MSKDMPREIRAGHTLTGERRWVRPHANKDEWSSYIKRTITAEEAREVLSSYETDVVGNNEFGYMNWVQDNAETIRKALQGYIGDDKDKHDSTNLT